MADDLRDVTTDLVGRQVASAKMAYNIFRGSYKAVTVPHWNDLPVWVRDALIEVHTMVGTAKD